MDSRPFDYWRGLDLWPRGHLKTHILTYGRSIQEYLKNHEIRILLAGSSKDNSMKNLRKIKQIFEHNTIMHWLFPECIPDIRGKWAETQIVLPRKTNPPEPTFHCVGVGGHITGYHFDVIRKDDLIDEKTEKSPEVMEKIIDWHLVSKNLLESPTSGVDHLIGTRWSCGDLYQYIQDNEPEYTVTTIPAIGTGSRKTREGFSEIKLGVLDQPNWPERFKLDALHDLRVKEPYQFACSRGDQPILMADWTEKPISKVCVGDQIIGWSKIDGRQRLHTTPVLAIGNKEAIVNKITFESGRTTYQTADHRWWNNRQAWAGFSDPYTQMGVGDKLVSCYRPVEYVTLDQQITGAWLGGMFDGEGSITSNSSTFVIYQSMKTNQKLCEHLCNAFDSIGVTVQLSIDERNGVALMRISDRSSKLRFKKICHPHKLDDYNNFGSRLSEDFGEEQIASSNPQQQEDVFWLTTGTGNYVVSGLLSSNCQQMNNPRDAAVVDFNANWLRYYTLSTNAEELLLEAAHG